jgi:hypothetical protein
MDTALIAGPGEILTDEVVTIGHASANEANPGQAAVIGFLHVVTAEKVGQIAGIMFAILIANQPLNRVDLQG